MFRFLVVMFSLLIFLGCTINTQDISKKENDIEIKTKLIKPWPEEEKGFWTSMLFAQLSAQPHIRQRFLPIHLYKTVECVIDEYEKRFEFEMWKDQIGSKMNGTLPPDLAQVAYQVTYYCSTKQLQMQKKEIEDGKFNTFNEKDAI
jgi:hypothetical protein